MGKVGLLAAAVVEKANKLVPSLPVWGSLFGLFLILEFLPIFWKGCPWETFSGTVWDAEAWWHFTRLLVGVTLIALGAHFLWHVPAAWLIAAGVGSLIAIGLHLFVPHL